ncbi:head GIN domain-containing protein [uncultured Lutibacter sp.]|uniref:head GIN domain-containing protein n=1 Tax=uncultured Lutibacter sp. TaxID=437739 RepID=UPI00262E11F1|nr:head GIN domain-containing protein [uncultured Lutibacter sp.]
MKKLVYILCLIAFISCNSEDSGDCFQTAGEIIQQEFEVSNFSKILIQQKVALIITEGPIQKVVVETGKNLLPDIDVKVVDEQIIVTNYNECNFFRDYGITKVYITSPNITEIRNASELNVISEGILTYPSLYLRSTGEGHNFLSVGDWHLNIDNNNTTIWSNGISNYYLKGKTNKLNIVFTDGDTRFEGKDFIAKKVSVKNVSSNDILVYPTESLTGSIHSTGDVISFNKPPIIEIDAQSVGKLIFK